MSNVKQVRQVRVVLQVQVRDGKLEVFFADLRLGSLFEVEYLPGPTRFDLAEPVKPGEPGSEHERS